MCPIVELVQRARLALCDALDLAGVEGVELVLVLGLLRQDPIGLAQNGAGPVLPARIDSLDLASHIAHHAAHARTQRAQRLLHPPVLLGMRVAPDLRPINARLFEQPEFVAGLDRGHQHRLDTFLPDALSPARQVAKQSEGRLTIHTMYICQAKASHAPHPHPRFTQIELAAELGISQRMVAYYESPAATPPANPLPQIATALGVTIDEMFGRSAKRKLAKQEGDSRLRRRLLVIEKLDVADKRRVLQVIDAFIERGRLKRKAESRA
jgi:transcriptional regulator with XRE-family HTH domain